jgi:hypothetical protein
MDEGSVEIIKKDFAANNPFGQRLRRVYRFLSDIDCNIKNIFLL